jgi:hypothetical protein
MATFTVGLKGKTEKAQGGLGPRVVEGLITHIYSNDAIHAKDVDLKAINTLVIQPSISSGTVSPYVTVNDPGGLNNYASVVGIGSVTTSGSALHFIAIGE